MVAKECFVLNDDSVYRYEILAMLTWMAVEQNEYVWNRDSRGRGTKHVVQGAGVRHPEEHEVMSKVVHQWVHVFNKAIIK